MEYKNPFKDVELKLLGTYMESPDLFEKSSHLVSDGIFTKPFTKATYKIIKAFHAQGTKPDTSLVFAQLKGQGFSREDCSEIFGAQLDYSILSQPEPYVDILFKNSVANYLLPLLQNTHQQLSNESGDSLELMDKLSEAINKVNLVVNNVSKEKPTTEIFDEAMQRIMDLKNNVIENMGYPFGLKELDSKTGGVVKGITVVGATPGSGKTSLIINLIVTNAIEGSVPMVFFSIEMPAIEIMTNIIANKSDINSRALRQGDVDEGQIMSIQNIKDKIDNNFVIDENGGVTWQYIEAKLKSFRKKNKIPMTQTILSPIDYLQLMSNSVDEIKGTTDEQRISKICKELARISKNENIAFVLLSQLSRPPKGEVPRPKMSDLKGSGAIEANAILVLLLFRPEYSGIMQDEQGRDLRGICEINPAKGRYIKPEPVYVRFVGKHSKFLDYDNQSGSESAF